MNQKVSPLKGNRILSIRKDFEFIGEDLENMKTYIRNTPKDIF